MVDLRRDIWIRETGTGQQVAELHDRCMMMMMMMMINILVLQITKELKIIPILDELLEYMRSWIQHVNRMP